jgi:hypothetical protein
VLKSRNEVARIKRDFAHLFVRNTFAKEILDKCLEQQKRPPHITIGPPKQAPMQIEIDRSNPVQHLAGISKVSSGTITEDGHEGNFRFEAFPPRTPVVGIAASRNQSVIDQIQPAHLNRFGDLLPRLTPPVQRQMESTVLVTPINKNGMPNAKPSTNAMPPPSPYVSHDTSKIIQGSAMKRKEMERLSRLTTPQSVRIRRERRATARTSTVSRKRTVFNPDDDVESTPPSTDAQPKAPTSILRDNSNKRPRLSSESFPTTLL